MKRHEMKIREMADLAKAMEKQVRIRMYGEPVESIKQLEDNYSVHIKAVNHNKGKQSFVNTHDLEEATDLYLALKSDTSHQGRNDEVWIELNGKRIKDTSLKLILETEIAYRDAVKSIIKES